MTFPAEDQLDRYRQSGALLGTRAHLGGEAFGHLGEAAVVGVNGHGVEEGDVVVDQVGAFDEMEIGVLAGGDEIADSLGWPVGYTDADIYRPMVNLRLGTHYLDNNRQLLGGDLYAALAAYNAGPGNAQIWQSLAGGDPDLFVELVRFSETRDYIRLIYETYNTYRSLYSPLPE